MKALSIKQPWAWAICNLPDAVKKDIENRTWNTNYRGEFLVHASKSFDDAGYERMKWYLKILKYEGTIPAKDEFVFGSIIGKTTLVDVTQKAISRWFEGEYGFKLANTVAFEKPIPYKGQLGFFEVGEHVINGQLFILEHKVNNGRGI